MYHFIKSLLINNLTKSFWIRFEFQFRHILYLFFYRGNVYYCNLCDQHLKSFIHHKNGQDHICPNCGSLSRTRILWDYLNHNNAINKDLKLLHFSPQRYLRKKLKNIPHIQYTDTDFLSHDCQKNYNICAIDAPSESYDLVICYHILEHIKEDQIAMRELNRITSKNGQILIQVPLYITFSEEPLDHNYSSQQRLRLFDQEDHVRCYTEDVINQRLKQSGLHVKKICHATQLDIKKLALNSSDTIFLCTKS